MPGAILLNPIPPPNAIKCAACRRTNALSGRGWGASSDNNAGGKETGEGIAEGGGEGAPEGAGEAGGGGCDEGDDSGLASESLPRSDPGVPVDQLSSLSGTEVVISLCLQCYRIAARIQHHKVFSLTDFTYAGQWNILFMRKFSNAFPCRSRCGKAKLIIVPTR